MKISVFLCYLATSVALLFTPLSVLADDEEKRFIVKLKDLPILLNEETKPARNAKVDPNDPTVMEYISRLQRKHRQVATAVGVDESTVVSYTCTYNGFSASMTQAQASAIAREEGVVNVVEDQRFKLNTDTTPEFLGLTASNSPWTEGYTGEDLVVGVIDSGINPFHQSFADVDTPENGNRGEPIPYGPTPPTFTPSGCDFLPGQGGCSNKLLTAKCYIAGYSLATGPGFLCGGDGLDLPPGPNSLSALDTDDHGSLCASISAGNWIENTMSGMAPRARVASYKACWQVYVVVNGIVFVDTICHGTDLLSAIDQAALDGVDVINYSIGSTRNLRRPILPLEEALLCADDAGILVAAAAGNSGDQSGTIGRPAGLPWITAVGAGFNDDVAQQNKNFVADFSSRGENEFAPDIIKPDLVAPGVEVFGAGHQGNVVVNGTSFACPHVAGIFALLKQAHPDWSPAVARSAVMTTADPDLNKELGGDPADPFDIGSGHLVPGNAFDPGLAYDAGLEDYHAFLCGNGVDFSEVDIDCDDLADRGFSFDGSALNYPSIAVSDLAHSKTVIRTVTSVANSAEPVIFTATVDEPRGISVTVSPSEIMLTRGETATYRVTITATGRSSRSRSADGGGVPYDRWVFGSITWSNSDASVSANEPPGSNRNLRVGNNTRDLGGDPSSEELGPPGVYFVRTPIAVMARAPV